MPRKALDMSRGVLGFLPEAIKKPLRALCWLSSAFYTLRRGSCQENRGINRYAYISVSNLVILSWFETAFSGIFLIAL